MAIEYYQLIKRAWDTKTFLKTYDDLKKSIEIRFFKRAKKYLADSSKIDTPHPRIKLLQQMTDAMTVALTNGGVLPDFKIFPRK